MITEAKEKRILRISFYAGLIFALIELVFAIYSHSQSALTDAFYDASELIFIALLLFLTPLFHYPVSEKHPYGYFQVESIFVLIKGVMMLAVTLGVLLEIIESSLLGGNIVNLKEVSIFQFILGIASIIVYLILKKSNKNLNAPTVNSEILGWKLDIYYSCGMSLAFTFSNLLSKSSLAFLTPYFDPLIAVFVIVGMLPENIALLWKTLKDIFLFAPEDAFIEEIKEETKKILTNYQLEPVFYDITRTGRHLWVAIYYQVDFPTIEIETLKKATTQLNELFKSKDLEATCELVLNMRNDLIHSQS